MKYIEDFYIEWKDKSIAVIGNAKFNTKYGDEIDKHDIVIRINLCITDGYEEYVGKKLNIMCLGQIDMFDFPDFKPILEKKKYDAIFSFYKKDKPEYCKKNMYLPRLKYFNMCIDELNKINDTAKFIKKPTTGFVLLYSLFLNKINADVYGFDFYENTVYAYYADNAGKECDFFKVHDINSMPEVHRPNIEKKFFTENKWFNFRK